MDVTEEHANNARYYIIKNWDQVLAALDRLREFNFVKNELEQLFNLGIHFQTPSQQLKADQSQYNQFKARFDKIKSTIKETIEIISEFFPDDIEDQLNIKLPENVSLSEFSKITDDLDYIFNKCEVISGLNDRKEVRTRKVDSGSIWLIIFISHAAVSLIGKLCSIVFGICQQRIETQKGIQQVRVLKSGANVVEALEKELEEKIKEQYREGAERFIRDNNIKTQNGSEEINSLSFGIEKLANLFFHGVEIYSSLEAPKDVKNSFPQQEEVPKLASEILILTDSSKK
jgi:hypothetical protein